MAAAAGLLLATWTVVAPLATAPAAAAPHDKAAPHRAQPKTAGVPRPPVRLVAPPAVPAPPGPRAATPFWPHPFPHAACVPKRAWAADAGLFLVGAAGAFVAHELGHVAVNLFAGNVPRLVGLRGLAGVPFFAISPEVRCTRRRCTGAQGQRLPGGRRTSYRIAAAGFNVQHLANEMLLSATPAMRARHSPLAIGWLAFDVGLSVGYAVASLAHVEDPHGDAGGMAAYARVPRGVVAAALLVPAALDTWRYFRPQDRWAPWASRVGKLGIVGLAWRA